MSRPHPIDLMVHWPPNADWRIEKMSRIFPLSSIAKMSQRRGQFCELYTALDQSLLLPKMSQRRSTPSPRSRFNHIASIRLRQRAFAGLLDVLSNDGLRNAVRGFKPD